MSHNPEPGVIPCITVVNADKSLEFYQKAFNFQLLSDPTKDDEGKIIHVEMGYGNAILMFSPEGAWDSPAKTPITWGNPCSNVLLYVYTRNVDDFYRHAIQNGAESIEKPQDTFWGDRFCRLRDINGYIWAFATKNSA